MAVPDLSRVINSDEIQSAVNAPKAGKTRAHAPLKRNPLKNKAAMERLNPYAKVAAQMPRPPRRSAPPPRRRRCGRAPQVGDQVLRRA